MATYRRFEELPVWKQAIALAEGVGKRLSYPARDQIQRAALSVSNNIAEGYERGTTSELLAFLYIARGSAGEVRSMLCFFERRPALGDLKSEISNLKSTAESCSRQLRSWADSLQNSDIRGQRHLNDQVRRRETEKKYSHDFRLQFLRNLSPQHPLYDSPEAQEARQSDTTK